MTGSEHLPEPSDEQSKKFDEQYQFGVAAANLANEARDNAIEREDNPDTDNVFSELVTAAGNLIGRDSDLETQRREFEVKERSGPYVDMIENAFKKLKDMGVTNEIRIGDEISTGLGGVVDLSDENGEVRQYNVQLRHIKSNPSSQKKSQESYRFKLAPVGVDGNPSVPTLSISAFGHERTADMSNPAEDNRELTKGEIPSEDKVSTILDLLIKNKTDELETRRDQSAETQKDTGELQKSIEQLRVAFVEHEAACLKSAREDTTFMEAHNLLSRQRLQAQMGIEELRMKGSTVVMAGAQTGTVGFDTTMYYGIDPQTHNAKLNDEDRLTKADMIAENQEVLSTVVVATRGTSLSKSLDKLFDMKSERNEMDISVMYMPADERVRLLSFNSKTRQLGETGHELTNDDQDVTLQQREILAKILSAVTKQYESNTRIDHRRTTL